MLCVATGAGVIVLATAVGVAKDLLGEEGEEKAWVGAVDGEDAEVDGKEVTVSEGVPFPPIVGVGEGDVVDFVDDGPLADETFCGEARAPPAIDRASPASSTATPCFRLPIRSPRIPLFAAAIPPITKPARPISTSNPATLTPPG